MYRLAAGLALLLCVALFAPVAAQDDPDILTPDQLGLPELVIVATDEGWEAPAEVAAGRYLVTVTYDGEREFGTTAFLQLPEDWTIGDLNARFEASSFGSTPIPSDGTYVSSTEPDISWLYDLTLAGGISPVPGETAQGIIDLDAGNWAIWADSFDQPAIPLSVTGDPPAVQTIPDASVTITGLQDDDTFMFAIDGDLSPGLQIVEVRNDSSQPMFVEFLALSAAVSPEQLTGFFDTPPGLGPDPALGLPADFSVTISNFYSAIQSEGSTQWIVTNFEPGAYGMACWLPDLEHDGASHASRGMLETFEVS